MKIYAVVDIYDDGVWISEEDSESALLFATLELAEQAKREIDAVELGAHSAREAKRYERWNRMNAARSILEANNFEGIGDAIPGVTSPFSPYEYQSKTKIVVLDVQE